MDYKEKYEDILARLERAKNDNEVCDERFCCVIDDLIPELAESEDEKVRKEIAFTLEYLVSTPKSALHPGAHYTVEEALAWLEKQGLKSNPYSGVSFNHNGNTWGMCARDNGVDISCDKHLIKHLEKQGEKLPVGFYYVNSEGKKFYSDTFKYGDVILHVEKQAKQKPEENKGNLGGISPNWSEEDKGIIEEVVSYLINYSNIVESKEDADRIEYLIDKIQDICPHQKQEWSEEDEQHIDSLLKRLDALCRNKFERTRFAISEDRDWLKSLRPQNTWKPSKEQIRALKHAFNDGSITFAEMEILATLYEGLKSFI